ncbi:MAG: hypothetical protein QXD03_02410 [Candidatus Anstonellales archaeon]
MINLPSKSKGITHVGPYPPLSFREGDIWFDTANNRLLLASQDYYLFSIVLSGFGHVCGGVNGSNFISTIECYSFVFDSGNSKVVGNLGESLAYTGANDSRLCGYVCGGTNGTVHVNNIRRFTSYFHSGPSTSVSSLGASISGVSANNSSTYGYIYGGVDGSNNNYNTIRRFQFSNDSSGASSLSATLSSSRRYTCANNSSGHGYVCGGYTSDKVNVVDILNFSNNSVSTRSNVLTSSKHAAAANNSSIYGHVCGGTGSYSYGDIFQFPFDSGNASPGAILSPSVYFLCANEGNFYGYTYSGYTGSVYVSRISKVIFGISRAMASVVGNISSQKSGTSANNYNSFY